MFGLSGTPSMPDAEWVVGMLLLVGFIVLGVRYSALGGRSRAAEQRTRGWQIGIRMVVVWLAFVLVIPESAW